MSTKQNNQEPSENPEVRWRHNLLKQIARRFCNVDLNDLTMLEKHVAGDLIQAGFLDVKESEWGRHYEMK